MKKILLAVSGIMLFTIVKAQNTTTTQEKPKTDWSKIDLSNRANDHLMIQYGYDGWTNTPDTVNPSGFSRHFNIYFMFDKPFKTNPHFSVGIGAGLGTSNIFFSNTIVNIKSTGTSLPFTNTSNLDHYSKFKVATTWLEAPLEFRYAANPVTPDKGIKAAIGLKFGTLLKAYTKAKNYENISGQTIYGKNYVVKESDKKFFNNTKIAATARFGIGNFSIDGSYSLTGLMKNAAGNYVNPYSIGLTISGL